MAQPSLQYFLCIAKHNNITRAAAELHITQQSLSNYLKNLEEYYGLPLFNRKPSLSLTLFGKRVYEQALAIQAIHEEIETSRIYYQNSNPIHIGFSFLHIYQATNLLDIPRFLAIHPETTLNIYHGSLTTFSRMIADGELDAYFASFFRSHRNRQPDKPAADFVCKKVGQYSFKAIISPVVMQRYFGPESGALAEKWKADSVRLEELSQIPLILLEQLQTPIFSEAHAGNFPLNLCATCDNIHLAMEMVSMGLGFSVIPSLPPYPEHSTLLEVPITESEGLKNTDIFFCSTETALKRKIVQDLWDMLPPQP